VQPRRPTDRGTEAIVAQSDAILLVNDIPDHKDLYASALRARGYHVMPAHSGDAALGLAAQRTPRCIIIDLRLPDMTAQDLCRAIKANRALRQVPIVVLARDVSRQSARASRDAGCSAWLARPTVADDLVRAVEHVLSLGISQPANHEEAVLGVRECPACSSEEIRAGVRVGPVQYYGCVSCGGRWRVEAQGEAIA
jgi:two-component system cell cycle response regulator DivK